MCVIILGPIVSDSRGHGHFQVLFYPTFWAKSSGPAQSILVNFSRLSLIYWEVLNGVGVDGVGVIFPFFLRIFPLFYAFFPFFYAFFSASPIKDKGKQQQFTAKKANFTPTPSAPTPCKTSRI